METISPWTWLIVATPGILSLIGVGVGIFQSKKKVASEIKKEEASVASELTGAALKMFNESQEHVMVLKAEIKILKQGIRSLNRQIRNQFKSEPCWIQNGNSEDKSK